jgi:hypothetical protein
VAGLDEQAPHYLGHAMRFWNQVYNWGDAGYALNRPALDRLFTKFPTQVCAGTSIADPGPVNRILLQGYLKQYKFEKKTNWINKSYQSHMDSDPIQI